MNKENFDSPSDIPIGKYPDGYIDLGFFFPMVTSMMYEIYGLVITPIV